ncbi:helix-turn-helix domain-containing protein [Streptomyces sp. NPDC006638]|uniref:helix-turn-helix transcriptional regulator n=1 Tax=Streptomyces sp. NPDC006638 TaxID=3157183 RepID=UPI0033B8C7AB
MTTSELATLLRKSPPAVRTMRHRGTGPQGVRIGREVLYRRSVVDTWLAAKEEADVLGQRAA